MTITRSESARRATAAPWEPGTVEYSMDDDRDCSAYVSWCWNIPRQNTVSLVTDGWMVEIHPKDLKRGDAVGHCGPGTAGADGHVQWFDEWQNDDPDDNHYFCWQQNGVGLGPHRDLEDFPVGYYKAYRFKDMVDDPAPAPEPAPEPVPVPAPVAPAPDTVTVVAYQDPPNTAWNSTLSGIAEHENTTVEALLALNPSITDPDLIYPDQAIRVR